MQDNQAGGLSRVVVLRLRRLALLHLLFVAVFLIALPLGALLDQIISAKGGVMAAFFGLGVASFFLAPPVVSFLYARKLNAWKAFWFATAAGIPLSLGGAFFGIVILAMGGRASEIEPGNQSLGAVFDFGIAVLLLPNLVAPLVSYLLLRRKILSLAISADC